MRAPCRISVRLSSGDDDEKCIYGVSLGKWVGRMRCVMIAIRRTSVANGCRKCTNDSTWVRTKWSSLLTAISLFSIHYIHTLHFKKWVSDFVFQLSYDFYPFVCSYYLRNTSKFNSQWSVRKKNCHFCYDKVMKRRTNINKYGIRLNFGVLTHNEHWYGRKRGIRHLIDILSLNCLSNFFFDSVSLPTATVVTAAESNANKFRHCLYFRQIDGLTRCWMCQ